MAFLLDQLYLILIITGLLTMTMAQGVVAPRTVIDSTFGPMPDHPVMIMIVRSWCLLITLIGALLFYAAFDPALRMPVMLAAGISKTFYVAMLVRLSPTHRLPKAKTIIVADSIMAGLYAVYLIAA